MDLMTLDLAKEVHEAEPDTAEYVGFWPRVGARAVDLALHYLLTFLAAISGGLLFVLAERFTGRSAQDAIQQLRNGKFLLIVCGTVGMVLYGSLCESIHGSTLGKRLMGFVVLHESKRACGFWAALGRQWAFLVDSLLCGLVGGYAMSGNLREQRYGDRWCRTVVVRRKSAPPNALRSDLRFFGALFLAGAVDGLLLMLPYCWIVAG